jgi:uncharacterized protein (DUF885 family)
MSQSLADVILPRPEPAPDAGALDSRLYDLVEARFRRIVHANPLLATYQGIHTEDERLGDGTGDAVLGEIEADRAHHAAVEAIDPAQLSPAARFEQDLELHNVRLSLFMADEVRTWERRPSAHEEIGDAIFLLFSRDHAPLRDRLMTIAGRIEAAPAFLLAARSRARRPQVRTWTQMALRGTTHLPAMLAEIVEAGETVLDRGELTRLRRAVSDLQAALDDHQAWLGDRLAEATDDWALGRERYDELLARRALEDLDSDAILAIGWEQLRANRDARRSAAREVDPDADEAAVIERIKTDHPGTFEEALESYRRSMDRARAYLVEHDLATIPEGERIDVIPTPVYLRDVMPFAAYFSPARFDARPKGVYIVTPAVEDDPRALREHYRASISNTTVHEAYPGHHLQLTAAQRHPSLTREMADAPEFVEGWGMYSEQMMREQGFDDGPEFRLAMHTDAIWRACRIILDIRMHRGEVTEAEAVDFLVEHTSFESANARAEVRRYTYTPGYQLSYLLGKVLILGLRAEEQRRLGDDFSLKAFHDTLLSNGSIPISYHRRLLRTAAGAGSSASAGSAAGAGSATGVSSTPAAS